MPPGIPAWFDRTPIAAARFARALRTRALAEVSRLLGAAREGAATRRANVAARVGQQTATTHRSTVATVLALRRGEPPAA